MKIKKLTITNLRAIQQGDFDFLPGMNLLVGVNGVGKSTVLDAIRNTLSQIIPEITASRKQVEVLAVKDITIGKPNLQISCDFVVENTEFNLLIVKHRAPSIPVKNIGDPRSPTIMIHDLATFTPKLETLDLAKLQKRRTQPLAVFYSTRRSYLIEAKPAASSISGGQSVAFAQSLTANRDYNIRLIATWYKAQLQLAEELPVATNHIAALNNAVTSFLPGFTNLHVVDDDDDIPQFFIDKNGVPVSVHQLSDGERGVLSMVLDLAKRLSQANPDLPNPLLGIGIVLIDELDLHLHTKWQRTIVENLTNTFPNCQFIATTHSPQIIGEVPHDKIIIIDNGTYKPASSYGVDSGRILEEILDTPARNAHVAQMLGQLYLALDNENVQEAKEKIQSLIRILGADDPEVTRSSTMINFIESDLKDEADN